MEALPLAKHQDPEVVQFLKRRNSALSKKQQWGSLFQKTYRLSQPNRNVFDLRPIGQNPGVYNIQGQDIAWYVFDLTLANATNIWVNQIVNSLCPAGQEWLKFIPGKEIEDAENKDEIEKELQKRTAKFFRFVHKSNFQPIVQECFYDAAVSTGFMTVNKGYSAKSPFIFTSNPPDAIYADEGPYGVFDSYYRDWIRLNLEHAEVMWPGLERPKFTVENASTDETLINLYEMIHYNYETDLWDYRVIHPDTATICFRRTQKTSNFIGWRVKKLPGETYGRGPAMDAAPAAGTINQALYDEIVSANFKALPLYMGFEDGVFNPNNFKMIPNTIVACAPTASGTWPLQPIPAAGDINFSLIILDELRAQINNIMHVAPAPDIDDTKETATLTLTREQKNLENRAAQDSRIQREFFEPFVTACIDILRQFGEWDDIEVDGEIIDVQFETPLVTSQGQKDVLELLHHIQFIQGLYGPEMASNFYKIEKLSPWAARKLNVDQEVIKSEQELIELSKEAENIRQETMEAAQAQEQGAPQQQAVA